MAILEWKQSLDKNSVAGPCIPECLQGLDAIQMTFGDVAPPTSEQNATNCKLCNAKFTWLKWRYNCKSCGEVCCSRCCADEFKLSYMNEKKAKVCQDCKIILQKLEEAKKGKNVNDEFGNFFAKTKIALWIM